MKQQCHISFIYTSWLILILGIIVYLYDREFVHAILWICFIILFMWLYIRYFPYLSRFLGYGSVEDTPAKYITPTDAKVFLYTGIGCPFCPIVKKRLEELKLKMGFRLIEIDVTFKPNLLTSKGIQALPVLKVGEEQLVGNATSEQLAIFIADHCNTGQST
jgi:hypothetical protein